MATNLRLVANDGSKLSSIFARAQGTELSEVHTMGLRGGFRLSNLITPWMNWALGDEGTNGDVTAKDGRTGAFRPVGQIAPGRAAPGGNNADAHDRTQGWGRGRRE